MYPTADDGHVPLMVGSERGTKWGWPLRRRPAESSMSSSPASDTDVSPADCGQDADAAISGSPLLPERGVDCQGPPQLTLRAVLAGMFVGVILCALHPTPTAMLRAAAHRVLSCVPRMAVAVSACPGRRESRQPSRMVRRGATMPPLKRAGLNANEHAHNIHPCQRRDGALSC